MSNYNIDRTKGKVEDIQQNLEVKKGELKELKANKEKILEAGMNIQASKIDEKVQRQLMESINDSLKENAEKGEALSKEMEGDFKDIENMKQETNESEKSNLEEKDRLERVKNFLEPFGLDKKIEEGIRILEDNHEQLEDIKNSLISTEKELNNVSNQLNTL
ncbi:MAG TPA: hypothetical protein IAC96_11535 [Candidatus Fimimorpha faecalis]|uniref:Uncharacterized protein n=1 Tax=Candidatus Fimimorpha faecalis TaxID=2840824 RepID=A0A9D1EGM3_9FIRM|nr:hypothetical protein [Candidatus Fimimorpha faecalis]